MGAPELESDALVLHCRDHGESDKIITLLTKNSGKFNGIAKGANRSKKRFVNKLELFSFLHIRYQESRTGGLSFIKEADLHTSFLSLRNNYNRYATASIIQEILLYGIGEKEPDQHVFNLTLWAFHQLDGNRQQANTLYLYLIRLFDLLGYRPDLSACLECGNNQISSGFSFNYTTGGLVCNQCRLVDASSLTTLSPGTINILNKAMNLPLEQLSRLQLSQSSLREAGKLLHRYGRSLFQRELHAWKIAEKLLISDT